MRKLRRSIERNKAKRMIGRAAATVMAATLTVSDATVAVCATQP